MTELITATTMTATNNNIVSIEDINSISTIEVNGQIITLVDADKKDIVTLLSEVSEKINDEKEAREILVDSVIGILFGNRKGLENYKSETFKKIVELKERLRKKAEPFINTNGITITKNYNILCERVGNDKNGNPKYHITIFDRVVGDNISYILKDKIKYRLLKSNKYSIVSYNVWGVIKNIITAIE